MAESKTVVSPVRKHWRYHSLALSHWYGAVHILGHDFHDTCMVHSACAIGEPTIDSTRALWGHCKWEARGTHQLHSKLVQVNTRIPKRVYKWGMSPSGHCWNYHPGTLSFMLSQCHWFENQAPVDFIWWVPDYQMRRSDLTKWQGTNVVVLALATRATCCIGAL